MLENLSPEQLEMMRNMLLAMDPPRHAELPRAAVAALQGPGHRPDRGPRSARSAATSWPRPPERGEVEFVHEVTRRCRRGSSASSWACRRRTGTTSTRWPSATPSARTRTSPAHDGDADAARSRWPCTRSGSPRAGADESRAEDLTTLILDADFDGQPMTDIDFGSFFVQLVTAGNDTTKTMLSSGLLALLQHPDQLAELRADPSLIPGAVEEILRWANPLHYFRRTAAADTELRGTPHRRRRQGGDVLHVGQPGRRRLRRPAGLRHPPHPNPHLSFGIAEHFCLGVHLARLEGKVFFEELLRPFPTIELAGEPVRLRSNLNNTFKRLPVRLTA